MFTQIKRFFENYSDIFYPVFTAVVGLTALAVLILAWRGFCWLVG